MKYIECEVVGYGPFDGLCSCKIDNNTIVDRIREKRIFYSGKQAYMRCDLMLEPDSDGFCILGIPNYTFIVYRRELVLDSIPDHNEFFLTKVLRDG